MIRIAQVDAMTSAAEPAKVGFVQANMGLMEKRVDVNEGLRRHFRLTNELKAKDGIDFVVWSETSVMSAVDESQAKLVIESRVSRLLGVPAIFGAVLVRPDPNPDRDHVAFNTALSSDVSGHLNGRYDKEFLLAFGEYIPFGDQFPIVYRWSPNSGRFSPGTDLTPLSIVLANKAHPVTMLICYEDILPDFTNRAVAFAKPELLVNMTNDAWFGNTTEPWEHLALAKLRAIEHRRFLVRSTNSGVSAVVDPVGRVVVTSKPFETEAHSATIRWLQSATVYEAIRDWPWYLVTALLVAATIRPRQPRVSRAA
jgi:apolipoprotein N-acyltransferase